MIALPKVTGTSTGHQGLRLLRKGPDAPLGGKADEGEDPQAHLDLLDQGPLVLVGALSDNQVKRSKFAEIFSRANASEGMNVNFCTPRSKSPNPPKKKIQATCNFWKLGKCQKGDKCRFLHKDLSKPPNKGDDGKPNAPATPATGDKPEKPRSPTPNGRRRKGSRGRSPNKSDKPAACCVHAAAAPASVSHEEDSWEVDFKSGMLVRHHRNYRTSMFVPIADNCPMALSRLGNLVRVEKTLPVHPYTSVCEWSWRDSSDQDHDKTPWVGKSVFRIIPDVTALAAGKPVHSARKSRKVSFQNNPKVYQIRASGLCRKLTLRPRGYAVCYADQENCPKTGSSRSTVCN